MAHLLTYTCRLLFDNIRITPPLYLKHLVYPTSNHFITNYFSNLFLQIITLEYYLKNATLLCDLNTFACEDNEICSMQFLHFFNIYRWTSHQTR